MPEQDPNATRRPAEAAGGNSSAGSAPPGIPAIDETLADVRLRRTTETWQPAPQPAAATLQMACFTSPGKVRQRNEDACALPPPGANQVRWGTLLVVADGVGGIPGGEAASQQAVAYLQALYYAQTGAQDPAQRLSECVEGVNALNFISGRRLNLPQPGLTTLVAAVAAAGQIWIANVGDSRAYLVQANGRQRRQLTEDHSSRVQALKAGQVFDSTLTRLTGQPPGDNTITRAIGMGPHFQVDTYRYAWVPGDCLVLCSDGLAELPAQEMVDIVLSQPVEAAARRLVERAVIIDGSDNCTAALVLWVSTDGEM